MIVPSLLLSHKPLLVRERGAKIKGDAWHLYHKGASAATSACRDRRRRVTLERERQSGCLTRSRNGVLELGMGGREDCLYPEIPDN